MFEKILIANRGEIACRVARTAKRLGIRTVAVYSEADAGALHVQQCDEAFLIGAPHPRDSYLRAERILEAATKSGAQAIHPGYGFLSENASFARACQQAGRVFIGPPAAAIEAMGSKAAAKALMEKARVPLVPGYHGANQEASRLRDEADRIGYPVLIKASAGGGGKGMRIVGSAAEFSVALASAQRESASSFGDDRVLIEKYLARPRHIEIQVFADSHGHCVSLFERDCSVQRRHQKILEEAPAPGLAEDRRREMSAAAIAAAKAVGYVGAGTVEFIVDENGRFFFMEMNTRLQVEHPVTEMITGLDLVEWQLRVAAGESLPLTQEQIAIRGHAIEARIYAEDPVHDFLPKAGRVDHLRLPAVSAHVRVDSGVQEGDDVGVFYDPMIAKLIVWDRDRSAALRRLRAALGEYQITGLPTNIELLKAIVSHTAFAEAHRDPGLLDTGLIERHRAELFPPAKPVSDDVLAIAVLSELRRMEMDAEASASTADPYSPWNLRNGWRPGADHYQEFIFLDRGQRIRVVAHYRRDAYLLALPGASVRASLVSGNPDLLTLIIEGRSLQASVVRRPLAVTVFFSGGSHTLHLETSRSVEEDDAGGHLVSPLPGAVLQVPVKSGDTVTKGQTLMIIEAMKMEHAIVAPHAGTVSRIYFAAGEQVGEGEQLLDFEVAAKT